MTTVETERRVIRPDHDTAQAINWLANNDLKALGFVGLSEIGEATRTDLANELKDHVHPDAYDAGKAYPITYAKAGFADVYEGMGGFNGNRPTSYYTAVHTNEALPVIGSLLEWSETYDFPLVTALSTTASKGKGSAPVNTIQLLDGLRQGLTVPDMDLTGYALDRNGWTTAHNTRLKKLVKLGLVGSSDEPIPVQILDPEYRGNHPFDQLKAGRQGFYRTVMLAKELEPDTEWTVDQLQALARRFRFIDDASEADFNDALMRAVSIKSPTYAPGVVEKQELKPRRYFINERFGEMVDDLVSRVARVDDSPRYAAEARDYAMDAYRTPDTAYAIAERALNNSPYSKR